MSVTFTGADRVGSIGGYIGGIGQLLPGLFGNSAANCSENTPVTRYELDMALASAAKDSKIALLEANIFTDGKFSALGDRMIDRFGKVDAELREVAVYQAANTAGIACLRGQVNDLAAAFNGLTETVIPDSKACRRATPVSVQSSECNPVYTRTVTG